VQVSHQQRRSHSFACHIAEQKHKLAVALQRQDQIAIIAAYRSRRLVLVVDVPVTKLRALLRQQASLDHRRELEITFQRPPLLGRKAVQADAGERIRDEAFLFHGSLAHHAGAVRAVVNVLYG
jgi:hypothetical protein